MNSVFIDNQSPLSLNYYAKFKIPQRAGSDQQVEFTSVGQAYAYLKAVCFHQTDLLAKILDQSDIKAVNAILKDCHSSQWTKVQAKKSMLTANYYKCLDNSNVKQALLGLNGNRPLFLGHNTRWCIGTNDKDSLNYPGKNELATVMTELRALFVPHDGLDRIY